MILVSVVVPVHNAVKKLERLLASLTLQSLDRSAFEVVVVDDGSTDDISRMVDHFRENFSTLTYVRIPNSGPGLARNAGVKIARGHTLAFTDADCVADPYWLEAVVCFFEENQGMAIAHGPVRSPLPNMPPFVHSFQLGASQPGAGNLFIRKDLFDRLDGFAATFSYWGEDHDLFARARKAGEGIGYVEGAVIAHPPEYRGYCLRRQIILPKTWGLIRQMIRKHPGTGFNMFFVVAAYRRFFLCCAVIFGILVVGFETPFWVRLLLIESVFATQGGLRVLRYQRLLMSSGELIRIRSRDALKFALFNWLTHPLNVLTSLCPTRPAV